MPDHDHDPHCETAEVELSRTPIGKGRQLVCVHRMYGSFHSLVLAEHCPDGRVYRVRAPVAALDAVRAAALVVGDAARAEPLDTRQPGTRGRPRGSTGGATVPMPTRPNRVPPAPPRSRGGV